MQADTVFQAFMKDQTLSPAEQIPTTCSSRPRAAGMLRKRFGTPLSGLTIGRHGAAHRVRQSRQPAARPGRRPWAEFAVRLATGAGRSRLFRQTPPETVCSPVRDRVDLVVAYAAIQMLPVFAVGRTPILPMSGELACRRSPGLALVARWQQLWRLVRAPGAPIRRRRSEGQRWLAGHRRFSAAARVLGVGRHRVRPVVAAVVFAETMINLRDVEMGFARQHVVTMSLNPILDDDAPPPRDRSSDAGAGSRPRASGVRAAVLSVLTPLSGRDSNRGITVPG
jgi:hypothetical protein